MLSRLCGLFLCSMLFLPAVSARAGDDDHHDRHRHDYHHDRYDGNRGHYHRGYYHNRWYNRSHWRHYDRPNYGLRLSIIPRGYFTVWNSGVPYYYYDGVYYSGYSGNYVVVPPPSGAVVGMLPSDYETRLINGVTYYISDGNYYTYTGYGYQVVPAPEEAGTPVSGTLTAPAQPAAAPQAQETQAAAAPVSTETLDSVVVNVPNDNGGYTAVTIKKSGDGFIGPQGEYYAEFPKVAQLKAMYVK